jgi:hypothetical protein
MASFKLLLTTCAISLSAQGFATDFSTADELFAKRDQGREATLAARAAYKAIIDQGAKESDLVRAVEGLARTYTYEGSALFDASIPEQRAAKKKTFNECWNSVADLISPSKIGYSTPNYWYIRATCLAQEAELATALERLTNLPKLNEAFEKGLSVAGGDIFEGGGIKRVKAAVKGNPEAKGLPGGLYNPEEALKIVDEAINAEAYPGNAEGFLFCENFRRKVNILKVLNRQKDAQSLAQSTAADFTEYLEQGLIPEFIRAETAHCVKQIKAGN